MANFQATKRNKGMVDLTQPRARTVDPWTSHAAAASAKGSAHRHQKMIEAWLTNNLDGGCVDRIGADIGLVGHAVGRRMSELVRLKVAEDSGRTERMLSGRQGTVWILATRQINLL